MKFLECYVTVGLIYGLLWTLFVKAAGRQHVSRGALALLLIFAVFGGFLLTIDILVWIFSFGYGFAWGFRRMRAHLKGKCWHDPKLYHRGVTQDIYICTKCGEKAST